MVFSAEQNVLVHSQIYYILLPRKSGTRLSLGKLQKHISYTLKSAPQNQKRKSKECSRSADTLCTPAVSAGLGATLLALCTDLQRTQQDRVSFHSHHHSSCDSQHVSLGAVKQISDYMAAKQRLQQTSAFHRIQSKRSGANKPS